MNSRFMLVGTPSGISLAPEGGAHQSIGTPLMGSTTPNLVSYEPAFADEVKLMMRHGFEVMQAPQQEGGGSIYLRLTTRQIPQLDRNLQEDESLQKDMIQGAYWHVPPTASTKRVIVFMGVVAPEALAAHERIRASGDADVALLQVTSKSVLMDDWTKSGTASHAASLLRTVPQDARLVTVQDGHPTVLAWLGSVCGHCVHPLGVQGFGQAGDIPELYDHYGINEEAIVRACIPC